jgi:putative methylase
MGDSAQKRLIRKLELELFLSQIKAHPSPNVNLEQYTLSESAAANMLYVAYVQSGIVGKRVLDLGCGTGRLAIGAAFLGAESVVGVDIDKKAIEVAKENSVNVGLQYCFDWVVADIATITGKFDTVLQNPPFGVQKRTADRRFLEKALEVANSVYSLHNHPVTDKRLVSSLKTGGGQPIQIEANPFIKRFVEERGGRVVSVYALCLAIPKMFDFHNKGRREIAIDLYVIRKR